MVTSQTGQRYADRGSPRSVRVEMTAQMRRKALNAIPNKFASYEDAAAFWDTHDTTQYADALKLVEVTAKLKRRRVEVERDEDVVKALQQRTQ